MQCNMLANTTSTAESTRHFIDSINYSDSACALRAGASALDHKVVLGSRLVPELCHHCLLFIIHFTKSTLKIGDVKF